MSLALAIPCALPLAWAVAECDLPEARPRPLQGSALYRKHVLALLRRYLRIATEIGRVPSPLNKIVLRGNVSSYHLRTFEDGIVFVLDVEKAIAQLDRLSRSLVTHIALEDYSMVEAALMTRESVRSVTRIYGQAMNRLTALFLQFGLLEPKCGKLVKREAENPK